MFLMYAMMILAGPLLGSMRGTLATLPSCIGIILYVRGLVGSEIYVRSGLPPFSLLATWIVVTFIVGWIYEKRKTRNFMLSWGILVLESGVVLSALLIAYLSPNDDAQNSSTIEGFVLFVFLVSLIAVALETALQAIVASIFKKKRRA